MISITQLGYNFQYRKKETGTPATTETWGIERVAAFMFVIEFNRILSQRYVSKLTFINQIGSTQYELCRFDAATNRDINKLVGLMSPYYEPPASFEFHTTMENAIDIAEEKIKEAIIRREEPVDIKGVPYERPKFLERPTEEEYERLLLENESPEVIETQESNPNKLVHISFKGWGTIPCIIRSETAKSIVVDGYVGNRKVIDNQRIGKDSGRVVEWEM